MAEALKRPLLDDQLSFLFADLKDNPKDNRINIPDREGIVAYLGQTRKRVLEALEESDLESTDPYLSQGYAWEFAIQHEYQHQETIFEMLQLIQREIGPRFVEPVPWQSCSTKEMLELPGGNFEMGSSNVHFYDNEKKPHSVCVTPFRLAKDPVTAFEWAEFMADGGYLRPEFWSPEGWCWKENETAVQPEYWAKQDGIWVASGPFGTRIVHPDEPVNCIGWYEAEAYANWSGKRLPTEAEWEWARLSGEAGIASMEVPNRSSRTFGAPLPISDEKPDRLGLRAMAGSVWQWTSSRFLPYPGFVPFPYEGYSWDHMKGEHFVCRGGSWATATPILRPTFRNWYVPTYRQGLLGMRLADS